MNDMQGVEGSGTDGSSFGFTGTWREFLPIAVTNFLLTIVTLGIYRFWAKARERRYLWSRTHFIDDSFEWTGTGKEMFLGFLIVMAVLLPTFVAIQFAAQALILRGQTLAAGILVFAVYGGIFYLYHVARFRALRYQLSRTWWHGIRGGSDHGGWDYGWSGVWKTLVGTLALGLLVPWAMTQLWNERWNRMSFGPHEFEANAETSGLMMRWLLVYLTPFAGFLLMLLAMGAGAALGSVGGSDGALVGGAVAAVIGGLLFYLVFLLASLSFYALFYRHVADATSVGGLQFEFTARTKDWLKLILGNIGLVIVTLGFGLLFLSYRNWSFVVRHMEARGHVDLDALTQSTTHAPTDAEGIADAFDFGAV
jgi:uncharacterized membrane protein YjgN (DUF898 family)